ncbi:hypothetical protein E4U36_007982 [Claviceps purpurea]|nr:hypothetical protein E4U36_007982 [Claviceps purpurea]
MSRRSLRALRSTHYTTILTFTQCGHTSRVDCPRCEGSGNSGRKCLDANTRTIQRRVDAYPCLSCRARFNLEIGDCTSILTYTLCGHKKHFRRRCRENFGSDGSSCSIANFHTTQQTTDKWPCKSCRASVKLPPIVNVAPDGTGTLQGDIDKDLQVKSVYEPTRHDGSGAIRREDDKPRLPSPSSLFMSPLGNRMQSLDKCSSDYNAKDDVNKVLPVRSRAYFSRQPSVSSLLVAEEHLEGNRMPLPGLASAHHTKDDINKDLQVESVDEPTRQEGIIPVYTKAAKE